jgi:hypothetical protein
VHQRQLPVDQRAAAAEEDLHVALGPPAAQDDGTASG